MIKEKTLQDKALELMAKHQEENAAIKKNLNTMAKSLTQVLEMVNNLRLTNIRLSDRIGKLNERVNKLEGRAFILPGSNNGVSEELNGG